MHVWRVKTTGKEFFAVKAVKNYQLNVIRLVSMAQINLVHIKRLCTYAWIFENGVKELNSGLKPKVTT